MEKIKLFVSYGIIVFLFLGCTQEKAKSESPKAIEKDKLVVLEDYAGLRPKFKKINIKIGEHKINVELAKHAMERQFGLMYVQNLPADQGMLFVFEAEQLLAFWMKNTFIPLSIAYINKDKKIVDIQKMDPPPSVLARNIPNYRSKKPAIYALEMNQGWFEKKSVKVGDSVNFLDGL